MFRSSFFSIPALAALMTGPASAAVLFDLGLSEAAKNSLVAHYDGRTGVSATGNVVNSWTPVDGDGNPLAPMTVTSVPHTSGGAPELITYDSSTGTLRFDDPNISGAHGRALSGTLVNSAVTEFTVFWKGSYDPTAPFAASGTYAYNIGLNAISHQRDDFGGGWRVEMFNGATYGGDDIVAYDNLPTVWSTVITATTHAAYANGTNLNITGTPTNSVPANASIYIGAFGPTGFDLKGDISQFIIFQSALSSEDRLIVEQYLAAVPEPSAALLVLLSGCGLLRHRRRRDA